MKAAGSAVPCECSNIVRDWFASALDLTGMQQAVLARRLSETLERSISGSAVTRMLSGQRAISADEMIAIARICRVPLPSVREKKAAPQPRLPGLDPAERCAS